MTTTAVSSISNPYSYLNQLEGVQNTTEPTSTSPTTVAPAATTDTTNTTQTSAPSNAALSTLTPEILSLLQDGSGNDSLDSLLGDNTASSNTSITTLLDSLYTGAAQAAITQAQNNTTGSGTATTGTGTTTTTSNQTLTGAALVDDVVSALTQASIAYNNSNLQNAQNILSANSYGPDGITPITA